MNELIKTTNEKEKQTLNTLFKAVPTLKSPWEVLLNNLTKNNFNLLTINDKFTIIDNSFKQDLSLTKDNNDNLLKQLENTFQEKKALLEKDFKTQQNLEKEQFFAEQTHIRNELSKIINAHKQLSSSLKKNITKIEFNLSEELNILNLKLKEAKESYLNKVSAIYLYKESEETRINNKFNDQLEDYQQKNKQRITQNSIKFEEVEKKLQEYLNLHEKDAIYAKQNYFKALTNLNEKINVVTNSYKELEKKLEEDFILENEKLINDLNEKKQETDALNDEALILYEKNYQNIDALLDELRENHHEQENKLKNKYNRVITSINVNLHNKKEEINNSLISLTNNTHSKRQIKQLYDQLKNLEKESYKEIKKAQKDYRKAYLSEIEKHVILYESALFNRTVIEQNKNDSLELNKTNYLQHKIYIDEKTRLYKQRNDLNKKIVELYKQLEIIPLETQAELSNLIYNLEINLQKLEDDYAYLSTSKEKQLINLKSILHEHNLNKTKNKITHNHELELNTSNLTNYFQMEAEKNDLVFDNRLSNFKIKSQEAITKEEILKVNQQIELSNKQENHKINYFNYILQNKIELKRLNDLLFKEENSYLLEKEKSLNIEQINLLYHNDFLAVSSKESLYLNDVLNYFKDFYLALYNEENTIFDTFKEASTENTNIDDFNVFLTSTKDLLLLKHLKIEKLTNVFFSFFEDFLETKIKTISETNLNNYKNQVIDIYDKPLEKHLNEQKLLKSNLKRNTDKIYALIKQINFLKEQKGYAIKTNKHSKKELLILNKDNIYDKNRKIINNLTENIEINNKAIKKSLDDINVLKSHIKSFKIENHNIKKSLKNLNLKINQIKENKEESFNKISSFLEADTNIFWLTLKLIDVLKEKTLLVNENHYKTIIKLELHQSINTTNNIIFSSLNNKHKNMLSLFNAVAKAKKTLTDDIINHYKDKRIAQINSEKTKLIALKKSYLNNENKIKKTLKKTTDISNLSLKKITQKDKAEIKDLQNNHIMKLKTNKVVLRNIQEEKAQFEDQYKQLKKAFEINKNELLTKEKETFKNNLKTALKENQERIKDTNSNIKKITHDIEVDAKNHLSQLNFYSNKEKAERKKLFEQQISKKAYHEKQIVNLKQGLPKIDLEINYFLSKKEKNEKRLSRKIAKQSSVTIFKNKFGLKNIIKQRKKELKKEFLENN